MKVGAMVTHIHEWPAGVEAVFAWAGHRLNCEYAHALIKSFLPPFYPHVIRPSERLISSIAKGVRRAWG